MDIEKITKSHWMDEKVAPAAAALAKAALANVSKDEPLTTTALLKALNCPVDKYKTVASHLTTARSKGLLDSWFTLGKPNGGTFGKPSVKWHAGRSAEELEELDNEPCETDTLEGAERAFAEAARLRAQVKAKNEQR